MAMGQATQFEYLDKPAEEAFADVQRALNMIGKVFSVNEEKLSIQGTSKYGLQTVQMKVSVEPAGNRSRIAVEAFSDDVWAAGAKNCINRLFEALHNLDNPTYVPSKTGMGPVRLLLTLVGFVLLLLLVMGGLQLLPWWVTLAVSVLGFGILVYFILAGALFGKK